MVVVKGSTISRTQTPGKLAIRIFRREGKITDCERDAGGC